jgi:peptide deformylase
MSILKVARMGHPVLRAKAKPLSSSEIASPRIQRLIDDMFETMIEYAGIGLAAPQVHEGVRLFVAGVRRAEAPGDMSDDTDMPFVTIVNPEIAPAGPEIVDGWEGCLSIPDIRGMVPRHVDINVRALDRTGRAIELRLQNFPARVAQHETDHLDGILFFDRMRSMETLTYLDEYSKYWAKDED